MFKLAFPSVKYAVQASLSSFAFSLHPFCVSAIAFVSVSAPPLDVCAVTQSGKYTQEDYTDTVDACTGEGR